MRASSPSQRDGALIIVTTSFPLERDGREAAGSFVADLAEALGRHHVVRVVAPGPESSHEILDERLHVFRFEAPDRPLSTLRPWNPRDAWSIASVLRSGRRALEAAADAGPTRHVLALWALPSGTWARGLWKERGIPYSVWTLGSDIWSLGRIPVVRRRLAQVLADAQIRFADGLQLADDTRRLAARDVEFLPSSRSLPFERPEPPRSEPPYRLLFLGRWHPNKGVDILVEALQRLDDADWQRIAEVRICGGGPLEPMVRDRAAALAAAGRPVRCDGYLDKMAACEAIAAADYLVIPSRIESIPVVFSDAMKLACPVVCAPAGDLPRLVQEGGVGLCAERVGDPDAFARLLRSALATSPSLFGARIPAMAARFSVERLIVPRISMLLEQ
ncbi:MAG TPA: glycosyltransferase [Lysobacter sp.]|nr:glycosyltransferase [Lysobacter sp.]